ncbi:MAG: single-stranded DNA-binding protein [Simkaniaceae bacterium]|nr:single-stranded DNA-binding protein [Simkaniaceae bacterium]
MNYITVMGRLVNAPEVRFTSNGVKVTTFRVAANRKRKGREETMWWRVTVWGEHLDNMISALKKGDAVIIMGEMGKPRIYVDKEGNNQVGLDVTAHALFFNPFGRPEGAGSQQPATPESTDFSSLEQKPEAGRGPEQSDEALDAEEIPF